MQRRTPRLLINRRNLRSCAASPRTFWCPVTTRSTLVVKAVDMQRSRFAADRTRTGKEEPECGTRVKDDLSTEKQRRRQLSSARKAQARGRRAQPPRDAGTAIQPPRDAATVTQIPRGLATAKSSHREPWPPRALTLRGSGADNEARLTQRQVCHSVIQLPRVMLHTTLTKRFGGVLQGRMLAPGRLRVTFTILAAKADLPGTMRCELCGYKTTDADKMQKHWKTLHERERTKVMRTTTEAKKESGTC